MSQRLKEADSQAVDLLLDGATTALELNGQPGGERIFVSNVTNNPIAASNAMDNVHRVFDLLKLMPASDPPTDLLQRTLDGIQNAIGKPAPRSQRDAHHAPSNRTQA
ncbi:MAG: hypothetical protein ACREJC_17820 [Tepidisphaeraceae bacterium]